MVAMNKSAGWRVNAPAGGGGGSTPDGTSVTIPSNGETITLASARDYYTGPDGRVAIVIPTGTETITARSNPATTLAGATINGTTKNQQRRAANGWHSLQLSYSAAANATFPISVTAGDIVICAVGMATDMTGNERQGLNAKYAVYEFVSAPPADKSKRFGACAIGWSGRGTPVSYQIDVPALVASLPSYNTAGHSMPAFSTLMANFAQHNPTIRYTDEDVPTGYEAAHVNGFGQGGNYGRTSGSQIEAIALGLIGNQWTATEKQTALTWMIRHGIDAWDCCRGDTVVFSNGGGHSQYQFLPQMFALWATGRTADMPSLNTYDPQNPLWQPFQLTPARFADCAPHSDATKPFLWRRRTVTSVSGTSIGISTERGGDDNDPYWFNANGFRLKRESDGAVATILSPEQAVPGGTGSVTLSVNAQPSTPFAVGNVVYIEPDFTLASGSYNWTLTNTGAGWNYFNPHPQTAYRNLNFNAGKVLATRAMGWYSAAFDAMEGYAWACAKPNYPAAGRTYPPPWDSVYNTSQVPAQDFWNAHAATLITGRP